MVTIVPAFVPVPGGLELVIILGIAILLFGANKLPGLARSSGQAMGEFKKGRAELENEIRDAATPRNESATDEESSTTETNKTV